MECFTGYYGDAMIKIENDFNIRDVVYLKHDIDQKKRFITAIVIQESGVLYECISGIEISNHYGWELSTEKDVL